MNNHTLLLIVSSPTNPLAWHAFHYAQAYLEKHAEAVTDSSNRLSIFFYADAAHTANHLRWQTADRENLTTLWSQLSQRYQQQLPVCVSTALARGVTDQDNAKRHQLVNDNLAEGFQLVGLGELAEKLSTATKVISF